jgi:hypothetical protein
MDGSDRRADSLECVYTFNRPANEAFFVPGRKKTITRRMAKYAVIGERMGSHSGAVVRPAAAALVVAMVLLAGAGVAHGSCTVKNTSGNKVRDHMF